MKHMTFPSDHRDMCEIDRAVEARIAHVGESPVLVGLTDATGAELCIPAEGQLPQAGPSFLPGSRVLTRDGMVDIAELQPGDLVMTRDHGLQPVRRIGRSRFGWRALGLLPMLRPVEIEASAFAPGLPARTLCLAPDHGVAVSRADTAEMAIVPARKLTGCAGVRRAAFHDVVYLQLVLDQAEMVNVEGLWCDSSHPVAEADMPVNDAQVAAA